MRPHVWVVLLLLFCCLVSVSFAQQPASSAVPNLINYSSSLRESNDTFLSSQTVGVTFAIYRQQDGGVPIWVETQNITTDATEHYSVLLSSTRAEGISSDLLCAQEERWLGVKVEGQLEQVLVMLVSVPYAFKPYEAETLGGLPASAFVKAAPSDAPSGAITDARTDMNAVAAASGKATNALAPGTSGYFAIWLGGTRFIDSTAYQTSAGNVGVGTIRPAAKLDVKDNINTSAAYQIGAKNVLISTNVHPEPICGTRRRYSQQNGDL